MKVVAKSDNSTGNNAYASYVLKSGELTFTFSAPYQTTSVDGEQKEKAADASGVPHPGFDGNHAFDFFKKHGLAVKAVGESPYPCQCAFYSSTSHAENVNLTLCAFCLFSFLFFSFPLVLRNLGG